MAERSHLLLDRVAGGREERHTSGSISGWEVDDQQGGSPREAGRFAYIGPTVLGRELPVDQAPIVTRAIRAKAGDFLAPQDRLPIDLDTVHLHARGALEPGGARGQDRYRLPGKTRCRTLELGGEEWVGRPDHDPTEPDLTRHEEPDPVAGPPVAEDGAIPCVARRPGGQVLYFGQEPLHDV